MPASAVQEEAKNRLADHKSDDEDMEEQDKEEREIEKEEAESEADEPGKYAPFSVVDKKKSSQKSPGPRKKSKAAR